LTLPSLQIAKIKLQRLLDRIAEGSRRPAINNDFVRM
jgi:hypothetical protein